MIEKMAKLGEALIALGVAAKFVAQILAEAQGELREGSDPGNADQRASENPQFGFTSGPGLTGHRVQPIRRDR